MTSLADIPFFEEKFFLLSPVQYILKYHPECHMYATCTDIKDEDGKKYEIGIERIHQEGDVAKSTHHAEGNTEYSLIDYNKSRVPLIEIVSKPNIRSAYQSKEYASKNQQLEGY